MQTGRYGLMANDS